MTVKLGKAKAVAAFLVTLLGAVAHLFLENESATQWIAFATVVLTAVAVYVVPAPVKVIPPPVL